MYAKKKMYQNQAFKHINGLRKLLSDIDSIPCINSGGCGISAMIIYNFLTSKGIECHIKFALWESCADNFEQSYRKYEPWAPSHVILYLPDFDLYIDSTGEVELFCGYELIEVDYDYLMNSVNTPHLWNSSFNRVRGIRELSRFCAEYIDNELDRFTPNGIF